MTAPGIGPQDKEAETALEIQGRRRRDKISLGNPVDSELEPKSPLPGNGIFRAGTNAPKRRRSSRHAVRETKPTHRTPPIRSYSPGTGKSPLERECVVADAVSIEPVSYPNSLLTGKFTGNFVEGGALAGSSRYNHT